MISINICCSFVASIVSLTSELHVVSASVVGAGADSVHVFLFFRLCSLMP